MSSAANPFMALLNLGLGAVGGVGKQNEAQWNQAFLINLFNQMEQAKQYGQDMGQRNADPARQGAVDWLGSSGANAYNNMPEGLWQRGNQLANGGMENIFRDAGGLYTTPEMEGFNQNIGSLANQQGGRGQLADQVFAGGGWTPQYQQQFDNLQGLMSGRGNNNQLALGDVGSNLIGQRGQTAFTQGVQDRGMDALNTGGQNAWLTNALNQASGTLNNQGQTAGTRGMTGQGMGLLQSGGANPFTNAGSQMGLQGIQQQGENPFTMQGQNLGLDYASREALMTPEALMNMARDTATDASRSYSKKAYRDAANRGSGAGATSASGIENQMRSDFGDEAARLEAQTVRDALMQRQALGLQQNQMGAGLLGQQGGLAANRLGQFSGLLGDMQGVANQRLGIGANLTGQGEQIAAGREGQAYSAIPGTQNAASNVMQILGQLGLGGLSAENQRLGLGNDMSQTLLNSQLGGSNAWNTAMGNQNQYALGAGQLGLNSANLQGNLNNMGYNNLLGSGQLGVSRANNLAGQMNNAQQNNIGLYGQFGNAFQNAMNPLVNLSGQGLNYAGQALGNLGRQQGNAQGTSFASWLPNAMYDPRKTTG